MKDSEKTISLTGKEFLQRQDVMDALTIRYTEKQLKQGRRIFWWMVYSSIGVCAALSISAGILVASKLSKYLDGEVQALMVMLCLIIIIVGFTAITTKTLEKILLKRAGLSSAVTGNSVDIFKAQIALQGLDKDDPRDIATLSDMLLNGVVFDSNEHLAICLMAIAGEAGCARESYHVYHHLKTGTPLKQDEIEALRWLVNSWHQNEKGPASKTVSDLNLESAPPQTVNVEAILKQYQTA